MGNLLKLLFSRMVVVGALILVQVVALLYFVLGLSNYFVYVYAALIFTSIFMVFYLISQDMDPTLKLPWVIAIMAVPIFGGLFYLLFGSSWIPKKIRSHMNQLRENTQAYYPENNQVLETLQADNPNVAMQFAYIKNTTGMPVYQNTSTKFLELGEVKFAAMLEELKKAKSFIFMEYFIIQRGKMWDPILEILIEKAKAGVDVRVMYDDIGCLNLLPSDYDKYLETLGIQCVVFNPFKPTVSVAMQNRDHRKILVVDGNIGFVGGINIADEYINAVNKHGHWKDSAVKFEGDAVWSLTLMFLQAWNSYRSQDKDFSSYKPTYGIKSDGYVQPYGDTPFDSEQTGESVYLNMINNATKYLYIESPYFIVDYQIMTALGLAAKRGVDVRVVTPHYGDKWYVHMVTRSHYIPLIRSGVKVYEYTPGFIHAKVFVCDDMLATVGTINMDYRSLYHHFECGALLYGSSAVAEIKTDFDAIVAVSTLYTEEMCRSFPWYIKSMAGIFRMIAPMM